MASTFKVKTHRLIGTSATTVNAYAVGSSTATTVIGLTLANRTTGPITADAMHNDGVGASGKDTYLIYKAPIPSGGSLIVVGGDQKVVLQNAHSIKCVSNTATSLDVTMSILEIT
jgi:hypothetical protein